MSLPSNTLCRARLPQINPTSSPLHSQVRHATYIPRPHRPYTFSQLVTLSDGSTFLTRTTSPTPVYKSTKDTRNHAMWQPSLSSLQGVELDEAGRLRAFRAKFGRGYDIDVAVEEDQESGEDQASAKDQKTEESAGSLLDLISGAGVSKEVEMGMRKKGERSRKN